MYRRRKSFIVGILEEKSDRGEKRTPLTPADVKWLVEKEIKVEIVSSRLRIFRDEEYRSAGAQVVKNIKNAKLLVGVKAPEPSEIISGKVYMVFSHTVKGQKNNIFLLKEFIKKGVTLIDYEKIRDLRGKRMVYFGRSAGICGMVDSLYYYGRNLKAQGVDTPLLSLKQCWKYKDIDDVNKALAKVRDKIQEVGFPGKAAPFIVGIIGRGNVSGGVQEVLGQIGAEEVHPRDMENFVRKRKIDRKKVYTIVFYREEKIRSKSGKRFYFEEYLDNPELFESNMDKYIPKLNILVNAGYWDEHYPRMVTKNMLKDMYRKKKFRLGFISDISCDVGGSIEATYKTSTRNAPVYRYDPVLDSYKRGYKGAGIPILAIDNLPTELPKDSSEHFSKMIREYVYQVALHGAMDVTQHAALPREIRQSVVSQGGELTESYSYLQRYFG